MSRQAGTRYLQLLDEVRTRNSVGISYVRVAAVAGWLALLLISFDENPAFFGAQLPPVAGYLGVSVVLAGLVHAHRRARVLGWYALVVLDAPAVILVQGLGLPHGEPRVSLAFTGLFIALVLMVFTVMEQRRIVSAAVTVGLYALLLGLYWPPLGRWDDLISCAIAFCIAGGGGHVLGHSGRSLAERATQDELLRERLGRFFSAQVRDQIIAAEDDAQAPKACEVTVLFVDLRGSTELAADRSSEQIFRWMDEYLSAMSSVVFEHGGTLDKFLGDGLLAYFGAPLPNPKHAATAVECALDLQRTMKTLNRQRAERGDPPLKIGIGIHSGYVTVGTLGPPERREYTLLGDPVNVASRLEGLTKRFGVTVLTSEAVRRAAPDFDWIDFDDATIRGKADKMAVFSPAPRLGRRAAS